MDITAPVADESVTNYTISIDTDLKNGADRDVTSFYLYDPLVNGTNSTGLTPDEDGYVLVQAEVD